LDSNSKKCKVRRCLSASGKDAAPTAGETSIAFAAVGGSLGT